MKTENHRVLIIDDERPVLMTLEALLKRHGYHVDATDHSVAGTEVAEIKFAVARVAGSTTAGRPRVGNARSDQDGVPKPE